MWVVLVVWVILQNRHLYFLHIRITRDSQQIFQFYQTWQKTIFSFLSQQLQQNCLTQRLQFLAVFKPFKPFSYWLTLIEVCLRSTFLTIIIDEKIISRLYFHRLYHRLSHKRTLFSVNWFLIEISSDRFNER
jgi:hypothetical protein